MGPPSRSLDFSSCCSRFPWFDFVAAACAARWSGAHGGRRAHVDPAEAAYRGQQARAPPAEAAFDEAAAIARRHGLRLLELLAMRDLTQFVFLAPTADGRRVAEGTAQIAAALRQMDGTASELTDILNAHGGSFDADEIMRTAPAEVPRKPKTTYTAPAATSSRGSPRASVRAQPKEGRRLHRPSGRR